MGRNNRPLIIGAAVFGLLALLLTMLLLTRGTGGPATPPPPPGGEQPAPPVAVTETTTRLVAARNIPPRSAVTEDMVTTAPVEEEAKPGTPGAAAPVSFADFSDVEKLVKQGQLTARPIRAGEPLSADMFIKPLERVVPANIQVPRGLRAIAIWVDPVQTAASLVDAGDRIDVIATNNSTTSPQSTSRYEEVFTGQKEGNTGRTIAQNLLVLAVDKSITQSQIAPTPTPAPAAPGAAPPPPPPPPPPAAPGAATNIRVLVAAAPNVAEVLAAANELSKLKITIRDPNDSVIVANLPKPSITAGSRYPEGGVARVPKLGVGSSQADQATRDIARNLFGGGNSESRVNTRPVLPLPNPYDGVPSTGGTVRGGMTPPLPTDGLPGPSGTADVTVIRGTDKSKVTVPAR